MEFDFRSRELSQNSRGLSGECGELRVIELPVALAACAVAMHGNPPIFFSLSLPPPSLLFLPFPLLSRFSVLSNRSYDHEKIAVCGNGFMIVDF